MSLTGKGRHDKNRVMKMHDTITPALKAAIKASGKSLYEIANACDVDRESLSRFYRGMTSLRLDKAGAVAAYFGLALTKKGR